MREHRNRRKDFLKLHFLVDVRSLLILSFKITSGNMPDAKQVPYLMKLIDFLAAVCADKGYLSRKVCDAIAKAGAFPYIPLKKNTKGWSGGSKAWREMVLLYRKNKKLFLKMYHRRSLAESVVSAVKRRFDHRLVSRKRSYQKKELMLKVITYNLSIVARTTVKA